MGRQGGCECRSNFFVKMHMKKSGGVGVGSGGRVWVGIRVDVNEELKVL